MFFWFKSCPFDLSCSGAEKKPKKELHIRNKQESSEEDFWGKEGFWGKKEPPPTNSAEFWGKDGPPPTNSAEFWGKDGPPGQGKGKDFWGKNGKPKSSGKGPSITLNGHKVGPSITINGLWGKNAKASGPSITILENGNNGKSSLGNDGVVINGKPWRGSGDIVIVNDLKKADVEIVNNCYVYV